MKQRFSSLDVKVIAHELSSRIVSLRLANIYDLSSRIFLLKLAKPDHREQCIIDSGFRCHLTSFARATAAAPSPFVTRLRKFLRTRRVTAVSQVGTDRVLEIEFSDGAYRLFLEFYAGGNIVLTDKELTIIALLRSVSDGAEHEQYKLGLKYNLSLRQNYDGVPLMTKERLKDGLERAIEKQQEEAQKPGKKIKKKAGDALRKALAITTTEYPPVLIDHALHVTGIDRQIQPDEVVASDALLDQVLEALDEARKVVSEITSGEVAKGYILAKQNSSETPTEASGAVEGHDGLMYEDFHPFKPAQLAIDSSITFLEYAGFNATVDEFFSSIEGQKLESRLQEREDNANRRIEQARQEQAKRIDGLQQVQELNVQKAQAIEANVERVEEAVAAVNGLIAQGMDWVDIGHLVENEQKRHNPVAEMIKLPLKLHENTVTLLLSEFDNVDEADMADETDSEPSDNEDGPPAVPSGTNVSDKRLAVDIDLASSAWSNARQYYDQKRSAAAKQEKTAQASGKALKNTEQKVLADLKKGLKQEKEVLRPVRNPFWFEKFIYFLSSDGYLVLAGKDARQNEILYQRYLKKGDVYVHADLDGAASVVIKNSISTPEAPIPPSTLSQAGNLAVCTSNAWDSKAVMSAWWVHSDQVSKTAPTGEYLAAGTFMVKGRKNFLPPAQLLLGFAVLFQISEESRANHVKHRLLHVEDFPGTPDLTDAETLAESSMAGDGDESDDSSDDDFPDAPIGSAPRIEDEDDDFPDVVQEVGDISSDEIPDAQLNRTYGFVAENDEDGFVRNNPLQTNGVTASTIDRNEEDDEGDDENEDDEPSDDEDHAEHQEEDQADDESTATPGTSLAAGKDDDEDEQTQPLSNKERKALQKAEKMESPEYKAPKTKPNKHARGKRGKAKKIATKYADQDEEDRELAMQLLGSKAGENKRQAEAAAKAAKTESVEDARARRRAQHEKAQREGLEAEEIRRLNLERGVVVPEEDEPEALIPLDTLIGTPLHGDEIIAAIPVCAPWTALSKFKYKAKMQPGQQKKGKAVREILGKWTKDLADPKKFDPQSQDLERIWPREAELIKGWREAEVVGIIPVRQVRVMMSGGGSGGGDKGKNGKKTGKGKASRRR